MWKMSIKNFAKNIIVELGYRVLRPLGFSDESLLRFLHHRIRYPQWRRIVRRTGNRSLFEPDLDGPNIKLLSMVGNMPLTHFEIPLALALQARGANVELIFCDGSQRQLCSALTIDALEKRPKDDICRECIGTAVRFLRRTPQLRYRLLRDLIPPERNEELLRKADSVPVEGLATYEVDGARLGYAALQTALRYWRRGTFRNVPEEEVINRKLLHSSMLTLEAAKVLYDEGTIDAALFSHGIYTSWGPAADFFTQKGIYWATHREQVRKKTYSLQANGSCAFADISKPFYDRWSDRPLTEEQRDRGLNYLASRADFSQDTRSLTYGVDVEKEGVIDRLELRRGIPVLSLFGNMAWDVGAVGRDLAFDSIVEWVRKTVRFIADRPDKLQLIIKPHPAEAIRGTRQALADEVRHAFPELPANVVLLSPETEISAHSIFKVTDVGVVHTSTVGMEMSIMGIPVVVASWTHYRGYGFTFDPNNREEYFSMLADPEALRAQMTQDKRELALKYFYVRCFHNWLELPMVKFDSKRAPYGWCFESLDELLPGGNENLDFVCDAILSHREDFVKDCPEQSKTHVVG